MREADREALASKPEGRIAWSRRKWDGRLRERIVLDPSFPAGGDPLAVLCLADPTRKALYLDWLCRTYVRERFLAEDTPRIRDTMLLFERWKHRLPPDLRDISRHGDEQSVWTALEPFDPSRRHETDVDDPVGRERKRRDRARALAESETLEPEGLDGWTCASPLTHFAAMWWGRGTRWCTSMENPVHYRHYASSGRLRVFIDPEGAKFQAHVDSTVCCDATDRQVNFAAFCARLPGPALELLRQDVRQYYARIFKRGDVPKPNGNGDMNDQRVIASVTRIPAVLQDSDIVDRLREKGEAEARTICMEGGWRLRHVGTHLARWALGLGTNTTYSQQAYLILDRPGHGRHSVPMQESEREPFRVAGEWAAQAPTAFRDAVAVEFAARFEANKGGYRSHAELQGFMEGLGAGSMPKEGWLKIAARLAKRYRNWIDYEIPEDFVDEEVAEVLAGGQTLHHLPERYRTRGRVTKILARNPKLLQGEVTSLGLDAMVDEDLCFSIATAKGGGGLPYVPVDYRTPDFCRRVVEKCPLALVHVPEAILDYETCLKAVERHGALVREIPARHRALREIWLAAVRSNPSVLCHVPLPLRDEEICRVALDAGPDQFPHVPHPIHYEDFKAGVAISGSLLARVPLPYRDVEMCVTALDKQPDAAAHVPPKVAEMVKADPSHERHWTRLAGRISSRYLPADPIRLFEPARDRPDRLAPFPSLQAAAANDSGRRPGQAAA